MKKFAVFSVCAMLCAAVAAGVPQAALAESDLCGGLDFSRGGYAYASFCAQDLIKDLGYDLFEGESGYLSAFPDFDVLYTANISSGYIRTESDGNAVTVYPQNYSYTAANSADVTWEPTLVNGSPLTDGVWQGEVLNDFVTVTYEADINLSYDNVYSVVNAYYSAAEAANSKLAQKREEYAAAMQKYADDSQNYGRYLTLLSEYDQNSLKYEQYLKDYAQWQREYDQFGRYREDYAVYLAELKAYEEYDQSEAEKQYQADYNAYQKYLDDLKKYNSDYEEYLSKLQSGDYSKVTNQLNTLAYMYKKAGKNRTIRGAVMGNAVTQVLEKRDELELLQVDSKAITRAAKATEELRDLITNYELQKTEEAKYIFYCTTYERLKFNFCELMRCLDSFYRNGKVKSALESKNKKTEFEILLAQLYEICNALDDSPVANYEKTYGFNDPNAGYFDSSYTINGQKPAEILGDCLLDDSGDAEPLKNGYPPKPAEPQKPEEVPLPEFPQRPERPTEPLPAVPDPGEAPEEVEQPVLPEPVQEPVLPQEYVPTEWEEALSNAFPALSPRTPTGGYTITLKTDVVKYFRNFKTVTVYFYADFNSAEPIGEITEDINSYIEYPPEFIPEFEEEGYDCTFSHWAYADGTEVDFSAVKAEGDVAKVYAVFEKTPIDYPVIWVVDGEEILSSAPFGSYPQFDGVPQKAESGGRKYRFSGWDRPITPMPARSVRYFAQFEESLNITWDMNGEKVITQVWKGEVPVPPQTRPLSPDSMFVYVFAGWDEEPSEALYDKTYTATYSRRYIVPIGLGGASVTSENGYFVADCVGANTNRYDISVISALAAEASAGFTLHCSAYDITFSPYEAYALYTCGATSVKTTVNRIKSSEYSYLVEFGGSSLYKGTFTFKTAGSFAGSFVLLATDGAEKTECRFTLSESGFSATMQGGITYEFFPRYDLLLIPSDFAEISVDGDYARRGEEVKINVLSVEKGKAIYNFYVLGSSGEQIEVSADGTFIMPASSVTVGVVCGVAVYTVKFVVDGKVVSVKQYEYGQIASPPASPVKAPDGVNTYRFTGWDSEFLPLEGDITYTAVFEATPLSGLESGEMSLKTKLIIGVTVGASVLLAAGATFLIIGLKKRRKKRA